MNWIVPIASFLEILLLLYVAMIDIATRLIRNEICLVLALLGIASSRQARMSPSHQAATNKCLAQSNKTCASGSNMFRPKLVTGFTMGGMGGCDDRHRNLNI